MPVNNTHPEYDIFLPKWQRARYIIAGEDHVKAAGERLLPRIGAHTDEEYSAYKNRAAFYNAAARTAAGYVGMIFRRPPFVKFPAPQPHFETDSDLLGSTLPEYSRQVVTEAIHLGRCATLIDWNEDQDRPFCILYKAEDILNWRVERVAGKMRATLIVLRERIPARSKADPFDSTTTEQLRILRLLDGIYFWQTLRLNTESKTWMLIDSGVPLRKNNALPAIPFVFHGSANGRATVNPLPLDDLIALNLDHYRLNADYKHGLHFTALPTAWLAGFGEQRELKIGSGTVWMTDNPTAKAGYLEYYGHGLTSFERALERDERLLAILGSRLLEPQKAQPETAEALALKTSGEESILSAIATALSHSLTDVLRWAHWWTTPGTEHFPDQLPDKAVLFNLNQDFGTTGLDARDLTALVAAWQGKAFSRDTLFELLRKGEILPDGRTNEQEARLLSTDAPHTPKEQP